MIIEALMLSSTIILLVVLLTLLVSASKNHSPKRAKVKDDIVKIKKQIAS